MPDKPKLTTARGQLGVSGPSVAAAEAQRQGPLASVVRGARGHGHASGN